MIFKHCVLTTNIINQSRIYAMLFTNIWIYVLSHHKIDLQKKLQSHRRKLQILKYEVILLLLIVYYMKQVPEANWRPSFRLREKRRVVSSYVGVMTRMKQSKGGARRPKAKKKKKNGSLHPNSSFSCQKIGYNRIRESIVAKHRTLSMPVWHNGQFKSFWPV